MLSIGAFLLGSQYTVGFDIDRDALNVSFVGILSSFELWMN